MSVAASADNVVPAQHIMLAVSTPAPTEGAGEDRWEGEGGHTVTRIARRVLSALPVPVIPTPRRGETR